jgi:hypothetical protein
MESPSARPPTLTQTFDRALGCPPSGFRSAAGYAEGTGPGLFLVRLMGSGVGHRVRCRLSAQEAAHRDLVKRARAFEGSSLG